MSIPMVPHRFVDGSTLDVEKVNDNLESLSRDIQRNLDKRYTYSTLCFKPSGSLIPFSVRRPTANDDVDIVAVEVFATAGSNVLVTCSDSRFPSINFTATATVLSFYQAVSINIPSSASDVTFTFTVTNLTASVVLHVRTDRGNNGSSHAGYTPTLLDSSSSTAGSLLDTELTAAAAAVSRDTANSKNLRCVLYYIDSQAIGSYPVAAILPSGVKTVHALTLYGSVTGADDMQFTATVTGTGIVGLAATITTAAANVIVTATDTPTSSAIPDDPADVTDDISVTFTVVNLGGAPAPGICYALLWYS